MDEQLKKELHIHHRRKNKCAGAHVHVFVLCMGPHPALIKTGTTKAFLQESQQICPRFQTTQQGLKAKKQRWKCTNEMINTFKRHLELIELLDESFLWIIRVVIQPLLQLGKGSLVLVTPRTPRTSCPRRSPAALTVPQHRQPPQLFGNGTCLAADGTP